MPTSGLEKLPPELLEGVCYQLSLHPPSLAKFARSSKYCAGAAQPFHFYRVRLKIRTAEKLQNDIRRLQDLLREAAAFHHVRVFEVDDMPYERPRSSGQEDDEVPLPHNDLRYVDSPLTAFEDDHVDVYMSEVHSSKCSDQDLGPPLTALVQQLPGLSDLVWYCSSHIPAVLLHSIRARNLRLHILSFRFLSLNEPKLDNHEFDIVTAPCLHTIAVHYERYGYEVRDGAVLPDYNGEALLRLVAGLAPNLKDVRLVAPRRRSSPINYLVRSSPRAPWQGFSSDRLTRDAQFVPGSLANLDFRRRRAIDVQDLVAWSRHTDFSVLRSLKLTATLNRDCIRWLGQFGDKFKSLKELKLGTSDLHSSEAHAESDALLCNFLRTLLPLERLDLQHQRFYHDIFQTAIERHGPTLVRLQALGYVANKTSLRLMMQRCHQLEELSISIRRCEGDCEEVASYMSIGSLPRLRALHLQLDAKIPPIDEQYLLGGAGSDRSNTDSYPTCERFDRQLFQYDSHDGAPAFAYNGYVRRSMVNGALDESLALSIWHAINMGKSSGARPLERLELRAYGGARMDLVRGHYDMRMHILFAELCRVWLVVRNPRDDSRDQVTAREVNADHSSARHDWGTQYEELTGQLETAFRRVWPRGEEKKSKWYDDWHSFPFQEVPSW